MGNNQFTTPGSGNINHQKLPISHHPSFGPYAGQR